MERLVCRCGMRGSALFNLWWDRCDLWSLPLRCVAFRIPASECADYEGGLLTGDGSLHLALTRHIIMDLKAHCMQLTHDEQNISYFRTC